MSESDHALADQLREAHDVIAQKQAEIAELHLRIQDDQFADRLRAILTIASTAGTAADPISSARLIELIVETAAQLVKTRAATVFLLDDAEQELMVAHAVGPRADAVRSLRLSIGQGIAGLVAMTGQPIAVADARADTRQARDVAERIGYWPESILCVPLLTDDRVIGVLELLDRNDHAPFTMDDMVAAGQFAAQAAVAIAQERTLSSLTRLIGEVIRHGGDIPQDLDGGARKFAQRIETEPTYQKSLEAARILQEIARRDESDLDFCLIFLRDLNAHLRNRSRILQGRLGRDPHA